MDLAKLHWIYRCRECGEISLLEQGFMDFLVHKKIRRPVRCHRCEARGDFEVVFNGSMISGVAC
jgi:hypothetical protein